MLRASKTGVRTIPLTHTLRAPGQRHTQPLKRTSESEEMPNPVSSVSSDGQWLRRRTAMIKPNGLFFGLVPFAQPIGGTKAHVEISPIKG